MRFTTTVLLSLLVSRSHGFVFVSEFGNRCASLHAIERGDGSTGGGGMLF